MNDPELEGLAGVEGNRDVLEHLRRFAEPARTEYRLGPWEQHVHPDLCERLEQVAGGARSVGVYGHCALVGRAAVLYAVAFGTSRIALRLPRGPEREAVLLHGGAEDGSIGDGWVFADAWLSHLSGADGTNLLTGWVQAARRAAGA